MELIRLLSNATRGRLAEFIVATAVLSNTDQPREEWAAFDLTSLDGIRIEVKSAAYVQSWAQNKPSKIVFKIPFAKSLHTDDFESEPVMRRVAEVYVFCLLPHLDKKTINPLNTDEWEFYVLARNEMSKYSSISLSNIKKLTQACNYVSLKDEVDKKYASFILS